MKTPIKQIRRASDQISLASDMIMSQLSRLFRNIVAPYKTITFQKWNSSETEQLSDQFTILQTGLIISCFCDSTLGCSLAYLRYVLVRSSNIRC
jgi:hypothetical protein